MPPRINSHRSLAKRRIGKSHLKGEQEAPDSSSRSAAKCRIRYSHRIGDTFSEMRGAMAPQLRETAKKMTAKVELLVQTAILERMIATRRNPPPKGRRHSGLSVKFGGIGTLPAVGPINMNEIKSFVRERGREQRNMPVFANVATSSELDGCDRCRVRKEDQDLILAGVAVENGR